MAYTIRNVTSFALCTCVALIILPLSLKLTYEIYKKDATNSNKYVISTLFRRLTLICAIGSLSEIIMISTMEGLWLFDIEFNISAFWTYIYGQHLLTYLILTVIFIARIYSTFKDTQYSYSNKFYIFLFIYFTIFSITTIIFIIIGITLNSIHLQILAIQIACFTITWIISISCVVGLFIHTLRKV